MNVISILKAMADDTRMKIITLLLQRNFCVRALARKLNISEAAVSQHLKILREAGIVSGEKIGYFVHYDVKREVLHEFADYIHSIADIQRINCSPEEGGCHSEGSNVKCCNHKGGYKCRS